MKKKIPTFKSDVAAKRFVTTADLSRYNLSGAKPVRIVFDRKGARVNMRLPDSLLAVVNKKKRARSSFDNASAEKDSNK